MSQELVFNELCVRHDEVRMARLLENAKHWLVQFSHLLSLLSKHKNMSQLRVPVEFRSVFLIDGYSLGRLLSEDAPLLDVDHRTIIKRATDRGQYLEDVEGITDDEGLFEHTNELYMFRHVESGELCRGFGAAHLLDALSISIDVEEEFWNRESIHVEKHHNLGSTPVVVRHACKYEHLRIPTRTFERNPKHDLVVPGGYIARLDLTDREAQSVLDRAVQTDGDRLLYGYCSRTNCLYAFRVHVDGVYHAYPVKLGEVKSSKQVLRMLMDQGDIDDEIRRTLI